MGGGTATGLHSSDRAPKEEPRRLLDKSQLVEAIEKGFEVGAALKNLHRMISTGSNQVKIYLNDKEMAKNYERDLEEIGGYFVSISENRKGDEDFHLGRYTLFVNKDVGGSQDA